MLLGSSTGRDGIGGASILASSGFAEGAEAKRPSVQIGDPFEEKRLIEACLELYQRGLVVGIQDLGAAGISCATAESAASGRMGMDVDLDAVHLREEGMTAAEILMSESQERMLAIVRPEDLAEVEALAAKWEIAASPIGIVTAGGTLRVRHRGEIVAEVPAASLSEGAPRYERPRRRPDDLDDGVGRPASAPRLGRCRRRAVGAALRPRHRGPVAGVPAVRPPAVPRHRGGAGPRRLAAPHQGHGEGDSPSPPTETARAVPSTPVGGPPASCGRRRSTWRSPVPGRTPWWTTSTSATRRGPR